MKVSPNAHWDKALALIRENVSEQQYNTGFKPIAFESFNEQTKTVLVQVPSPFVYEYLEENYVNLFSHVLRHTFCQGVKLAYRVVTDSEHNLTQTLPATENNEDTNSDSYHKRGTTSSQNMANPNHSTSCRRANQTPTLIDAATPQELDPQLNQHQTFSTFIEGDSNKLPRSVGQSIAEHPQNGQFNPRFIYGPSGCGKTHLINAIGNRVHQLYPQKRVLYISARLFQVQSVDATRQNTINDFIRFYQTIDLLIVDDIQEWVTAKGTQDTFFHVFNHLFRNGKRIILACDRPPVDLQGINERLITRFSCGLIAELEKPDTQLCIDILKSKIHRDGLQIPDDVIQYIAQTANGSVRDLEGVINSIMAYSVVYNCKIDLRLAERIIKRAVKIDNRPLSMDDILNTVCRHYGVSTTAVHSKCRKRELVTARQVSMYLAQKYTKMPASRIGKLIGGRDHSTVIHSCSQVEQRLKTDKGFSADINSIENAFKLKKTE